MTCHTLPHRVPLHRILALQGAPSPVIQQMLADFALARAAEGLRVAGVIETREGPDGPGCTGQVLRDLASGRLYPISQDLGPCSEACHLDSSGVVAACHGVTQSIAAGCDLVVLSKFGKLEADRGGLLDAFGAAIASDIPVLTAVAPAFNAQWQAVSAPLAQFALPEMALIEDWWRAVSGATTQAGMAREYADAPLAC